MKEEKEGKFSKSSTRKSRLTTSMSTMGKIPPQATDVEEAVLGALMLERDAMIMIADLFKPDIFYQEAHKKIAEAILLLYDNSDKVDILTVTAKMRSLGTLELVGGAYYITNLTNRVSNASNIEDHVKIIYQAYIKREAIRVATQIITEAYDDTSDAFELLTSGTQEFDMLIEGTVTSAEVHIKELSMKAIKERLRLNGKEKEFDGLSCGFEEIDKKTGGFKGGQMIVIAARPAMGKTAVAIQIANNIGRILKKPIAFFSLEMSADQIYGRLQAQVSGINSKKIRMNKLTEQELFILDDADEELLNSPIYIDDTSALNVDVFRARVTIMKRKYGIGAVVIDYMQLMKGNGFNREAEIGDISGKIKRTAKELDIPIIPLCQLSREVEKRADKRPQLSDLRESGSIEQDADMVAFLWRPSYYGITDPITFSDYGYVEIQTDKLLNFIIAKQREGETCTIPLHADLSCMQVNDHPAIGGTYVKSKKPKTRKDKAQTELLPTTSEVEIDSDQDKDAPF